MQSRYLFSDLNPMFTILVIFMTEYKNTGFQHNYNLQFFFSIKIFKENF
jgi:hypothetical protein